jgi:hypothetical protein
MRLADMSVGTDDQVILGDGFDPANQGTFQIVAHNGRNHMIIYNPEGGRDEIIDALIHSNGGDGDRNWRVGPLNDGIDRSLRIIASECITIGDLLRISTPTDNNQWFNDAFIGSWSITGIGYQALDYSGDPLPHTTSDGSYDQAFFCPYVDFEIPNAPIAVTDGAGAYVDHFLVGANATSIGFTEGTAFMAHRVVAGHGVNAQNAELSDVFLTPKINTSKMSQTFGTQITMLNKLDFAEQAFQGIDGYKIFAGLIQEAHRIIDGLPQNTILYPGVKAAGASVAVDTSLIKSIQVSLQVRPKDGITLNSITDLVKSTVAAYVNGLEPGGAVILSEIYKVVQSLPGVQSVKVLSTSPAAEDDRIVVSDIERAYILNTATDVSVG